MKARELRKGVHWVGAVDWDRRLFDELIPLPDGTSYNCYLLEGRDKTALIDTVDPSMSHDLLGKLDQLGVRRIDYVVANHAEQDHSGSIPLILEEHPDAKVVTTAKGKEILARMLLLAEERFLTVADADTLSLGDRTLEFIHAPWVHWPETMLTYLREDGLLFPCDLFGSHVATSELFVSDEGTAYEAAKRYYAEIMMPFRTSIGKHLERLKDYDIDVIAPSHGPLHGKPTFIVDAYRSWVFDPPGNTVVLPYVSMHGSTGAMVKRLAEGLIQNGVAVKEFRLSVTDIGKLAMALVDAATIVLGTPTVLVGPHPSVAYAAFLANALRPKLRFASIIGSYGWGSKAVEQLSAMIPNLKVEILEPVICRGLPADRDLAALDTLALTIATKHREHGLA